jgi:hypothetical protein
MKIRTSERDALVLDFDIECRPLAWYAGEFVTKQPTVISWKFINATGTPRVAWIGESDRSSKVLEEEAAMIELFRLAYDRADIVTGHFVRGYDMVVLSGATMRLGLAPFGDKLTLDTKLDLNKASGLSKSMENLGAMFELQHPKVSMNTAAWARANMLLPDGIKQAKERCIGDVNEHIEMYELMRKRRLLGPPLLWTPTSSGTGGYHV